MNSTKDLSWRRLVSRANDDPFFIGSGLADYKKTHKVSDKELATWLECSPENLNRLALCRFPKREDKLVREIEQIAEFAGCNADRLVTTLREVSALSALRKEEYMENKSFLLAARDRKQDRDDSEDS